MDRLKNCGVAANLCSPNLISYSQREPATEHFLSPFFSNICFTASITWVFGVARFHFGLAFKVRKARAKLKLDQSLIKTRVGRNMPQNADPWHKKLTSILICLVQTTSSGRLNHELPLQSSSRQLLIWLLPLRLKEPAFVQLKKTNLASVWMFVSFLTRLYVFIALARTIQVAMHQCQCWSPTFVGATESTSWNSRTV